LEWSDRERAVERKRQKAAEAAGEPYEVQGVNPVRIAVLNHESRYPNSRLNEIGTTKAIERSSKEAALRDLSNAPKYAVQALIVGSEDEAIYALQAVIDAGFDGTIISNESAGAAYFQLQVGPYETVEEANRVSSHIERAHRLNPSVIIITPEEEPSEQ
jgi:alkanesulfonate monooxygenase SsuD/methylene tetrahydromethanopterin reductase-like flavin-dependent oxidoreductase (luciferase family)